MRDDAGGGAKMRRAEELLELGGGAGPTAALVEEVGNGLDHGVWGRGRVERLVHFLGRRAQVGTGGHGPGEGLGASTGGRGGLGQAMEGAGDGGTEGSKDSGPGRLELGEDGGLRAAALGWE